MRRTPHLHRRGDVWQWRRRLPAALATSPVACLALSLETSDRGRARARAAALDALFEMLMPLTTTAAIDATLFARIMRAARDQMAAHLAEARAARGPDHPRAPAPSMATPLLPRDVAEQLDAFLAGIGDGAPEPDGTLAVVPAALAGQLRAALPDPGDTPARRPSLRAAAEARGNALRGRLAMLRQDLATNDLTAAAPLLDPVLQGLGIEAEGAARHRAGEAVLRGIIEAHGEALDLTAGTFPGSGDLLRDAAPARPAESPPAPRAPSLLPTGGADPDPRLRTHFSAAFEAFAAVKKTNRSWVDSSETDARIAGRLFTELAGDLPLAEITRTTAQQFRADLARIASDWGQSALYADPADPRRRVDARSAVRISQGRGDKVRGLSLKTLNKHTGFLNDFWNWASGEYGAEQLPHPFKGLQVKPKGHKGRQSARAARDAFLIDEIHLIFGAPAWQGLRPLDASGRLTSPATAALYFAPLIAAYGGLRLGEICQLRCGDLERISDFWVIRIRPLAEQAAGADAERNRIKSAAAERSVPVHPVLIRLGLIQYLEARNGQPGDLLFPELTYDKRQGYARAVGRWFTEFKRSLAVTSEDKKAFHSFRHTVRTMLKALVANTALIDDLIGHENGAPGGVGFVYEKGAWLRPLYEAIASLSYGIEAFGEDASLLARLRGDGFVLAVPLPPRTDPA